MSPPPRTQRPRSHSVTFFAFPIFFVRHYQRVPTSLTIVFVASCQSCEVLATMLLELEIPCVALHSKLSQSRRSAALGKFRSGVAQLLICTDVASR